MSNSEMYHPKDFFTCKMVEEVMNEFEWPESFKLIDDCPDGVFIVFKHSEFYLENGYEGSIELSFNDDKYHSINFWDAVGAVFPGYDGREDSLEDLKMENNNEIYASKRGTEANIRDLCKVLNAYFIPFIKGEDNRLDELLK